MPDALLDKEYRLLSQRSSQNYTVSSEAESQSRYIEKFIWRFILEVDRLVKSWASLLQRQQVGLKKVKSTRTTRPMAMVILTLSTAMKNISHRSLRKRIIAWALLAQRCCSFAKPTKYELISDRCLFLLCNNKVISREKELNHLNQFHLAEILNTS